MGIVLLFIASIPSALVSQIVGEDNSAVMIIIRAVLSIVSVYLLVHLYIVRGFKLSLEEFRIFKAKNLGVWTLVAIALPLAVSCFFIFFIPGTFAVSGLSKTDTIRSAVYAFFNYCLVAGITEELIFRAFIMRLLEKRWNKFVAVLVPSVIFGLLHIPNMDDFKILDVLMLLIAGTAVGIMFSLIAYQSGSIWASTLVHGLWNFCGGILEISVNPDPSIFTYTLDNSSTLLTGGAFGTESSLPAVIGYIVVIFIALILQRQNLNKGHTSR